MKYLLNFIIDDIEGKDNKELAAKDKGNNNNYLIPLSTKVILLLLLFFAEKQKKLREKLKT